MKRIISLFFVIVLCLCMCACGKTEAVIAFEESVEKIGTVTLDSELAIVAAESAYRALTDEEKESAAESYSVLTEKRKEYDTEREEYEQMLVEAQRKAEQEARLANVVALIDAVGTVTLDSEDAIIAAEKAYSALPDEEKSIISDAATKLLAYREAYEAAVESQKAEHAAKVTAAIDAIGTVTLDSNETIATAKKLYNELTSDEKAMVKNYETLVKADKEYDAMKTAEKQRRIDAYSKKCNYKTDAIRGISWYNHKNEPKYADDRSFFVPYIAKTNTGIYLLLRYHYTGDDWIFWEKLTIMVDGVKYYKTVGYSDVKRDNAYGEVWEYYDEQLNNRQAMDSAQIQMLQAIAESKETIIRFEGDNYYYDLYVSDKDKQATRDILALYEALIW